VAEIIVVLHLAFVVFVMVGGLLALRWPRAIWLHVPAALWGVLIELSGWTCPLTPLENQLRQRQGQAGYQGDFVARYLVPVLYPEGLTHTHQMFLGGLALAVNIGVYVFVFLRLPRRSIAKDI